MPPQQNQYKCMLRKRWSLSFLSGHFIPLFKALDLEIVKYRCFHLQSKRNTMQLLKAFLALGAVTLTAAQNSTILINSTSIPPVRPPVPIIPAPIIPVPVSPINGSRPGVPPGKPGYTNGTVVVVVKSYTTWCPGPTVVVVKDKTYTATGPTMLTITNCPCTYTKVRIGFLSSNLLDDARSDSFYSYCHGESGLTRETISTATKGTANSTSTTSFPADTSSSHEGSGEPCSCSSRASIGHPSSSRPPSSCPSSGRPSSGRPSPGRPSPSRPASSHASTSSSTSGRSRPRPYVGLSSYGHVSDWYRDGSWWARPANVCSV